MTSPCPYADFHIYLRKNNPARVGEVVLKELTTWDLVCSGFTGQVVSTRPFNDDCVLTCASEILALIKETRENYPNCWIEVSDDISKAMHIPPELLRPEGE
jgi:hypothetical protein